MATRDGGWQVNVEYFPDYVIKTPKTEGEIREKISRYLSVIGKMEELDKKVLDMQEGWKEGLNIVASKNLPNEMLGFVEFLPNGKVKQTRVQVLQDVWKECIEKGDLNKMEKTVEGVIEFITELWRYGVHEKTFKVGYEFGLMGERIMLIDFGELGTDKEVARRQLKKKSWNKNLDEHCPREVGVYFNKVAELKFTEQVLDENWGKYESSSC